VDKSQRKLLTHFWGSLVSKPQIVVHRDFDLLLGTEVAFRGLDRGVTEQELDLFDISAVLAAELRASTAQVVRPEALDPDLPGRLLDHRPDGPAAHALLDLAAFGHGAKQLSRCS